METLTIEDIDLYSQASRRVMKEDLYSIIDSCFMPCGVECDQYSVIGEIIKIDEMKNHITEEEVYDFTLECSDLIFHVCIAKKRLNRNTGSRTQIQRTDLDAGNCKIQGIRGINPRMT